MFFLSITRRTKLPEPRGMTLSGGGVGDWYVCAGNAGCGEAEVDGSGRVQIRKRWLTGHGLDGRVRISVDGRIEDGAYLVDLERALDGACRVYFAQVPDGVVIASHVRLLKEVGLSLQVDDSALPELMLYRFIAAPRTMFKGVRQLRAGEKLRLTLREGKLEARTMSVFTPVSALAEEPADTAKRLSEDLVAAHEDYGLAKGDFTTLLSGGVDSSILTVIGSKLYGNGRTYSCSYGFEDRHKDIEYQYANTAAEWMGVRHTIHVPTPASFLHSLVDSALVAEQSSIHLQTGLIHSVVRDCVVPSGAKVWSCGEGADGLFGQKIQRVLLDLRRRHVARTALGLWPARAVLRALSAATNRYGMLADLSSRKFGPGVPIDDPRNVLWSCAVFGERGWIKEHMGDGTFAARAECLAPYAELDTIDQLMLLNLMGEVTETQAVWGGVSESQGASAIFPFTHPRFVASVSQIPWISRLARAKGQLKDAGAILGVPNSILYRPKASFDVRPELYGPEGSVLEPLVRVAAGGFPAQLLRSLRSSNVFRSQMFFTALNVGLVRRHFEMGHSREALHQELDAAMKDLGVWDRMTRAAVCSQG